MKKKVFLGILYHILSIVLLLTPTAILFFLNKETYLQENTTKLSMAVILGLIFMGFVLKGALKQINGNLAVLISMGVFYVFLILIDNIISDLKWIVLCGIGGYLLFIGFHVLGKRNLDYYKEYRNEFARVEARKEAKNILINGRG